MMLKRVHREKNVIILTLTLNFTLSFSLSPTHVLSESQWSIVKVSKFLGNNKSLAFNDLPTTFTLYPATILLYHQLASLISPFPFSVILLDQLLDSFW